MASFENSTTASSGKSSPQPKVFINFREDALTHKFVGRLVSDMKSQLRIDLEKSGGAITEHVQRIRESKIALVIFSTMYTKSSWCLNELVEIAQRVEEGKLVAIPIFYKLDASVVKGLGGDFGLNLSNHVKRTSEFDKHRKWKEALDFISHRLTLALSENSDEAEYVTGIVKEVKRQLILISTDQIPDQLIEQQKYGFTDACFSSSEELRTVYSETDLGIHGDAKSNVYPKEAEFYDKARNNENIIDDGANVDHASANLQNIVECKKVESVKEGKKYAQVGECSGVPQHQVFINFHKEDVGFNFVSHLVAALFKKGVNVIIEEDERTDADISETFKKIEDSKIALVVFSSRYSESTWCLDELMKIKECMDKGKLKVIPISYKVEPSQVQQLNGDFGEKLWNFWRLQRDHHIIEWKEALESVASIEVMMRLCLKENCYESVFVASIVEEVNKALTTISFHEEQNPETIGLPIGGEIHETFPNKEPLFGMEHRMEQLEQKLEFNCNETRIIGVVGLPGIGKTTLAMMLHEKWNCKFVRCVPLHGIRKKSKDYGPMWLRTTLLKVLLGGEIPVINDETTHESVKDELLQTKVLVVLDDVSDKEQLEFLLGDLKWIKRGSKIVITTCDKSLLEGLTHDTYLVPQMNDKEAFQLFSYYALDDQICRPEEALLTPSRLSVDNAGGIPLAIKVIGSQLRGKDNSKSEYKLQINRKCPSTSILNVWRPYFDQLNERQKDVFLDIVWFFKSEDEYFVRSIVDSGDPDSADAVSEVRDLADKFLITISDSRVEMNDLVHTFGEHLGSHVRHKLWKSNDIINKLKKLEKVDAITVRGIFLDMCELSKSISLGRMTFTNMHNLRYLKIYDSFCRRKSTTDCELKFSYGLEFPLKEVRYLHWEKFPLEELPSDFKPENLVDLRLPYSKIERVWEGLKETPRLKWVDLSHSSKLLSISALSKAENLQRLNLEGCTSLEELPLEIQNMKSLVFLNLKGCIGLSSFPKMNLSSLKILILTNCSRLKEFQLVSTSLEFLHLDGTLIKGLPPTIKSFRRLVLLNLRNCKLLECLPKFLCELKYLQELILSGCSTLTNLQDVKHSMKHLCILRLDEIGATEMPNILSFTRSESKDNGLYCSPSKRPHDVYGVSLLQRLCLSGNDFSRLQCDINKLYNLKWLDVKQCKKLRYIPLLPPRLQYFDAHGCDSLESVTNPLAQLVVTQQTHATFNFTNCNKLEQKAKDSIISYTWRRSQLVLNALSRYNGGFVLDVQIGSCFPGGEVPAWFSHRASGSVLKTMLPPHWCDNKFTGIALCAVISFVRNHDQRNHLLVKCNCEFKNEDGSPNRFSFTIGGRNEAGNTRQKIESSHVFVGYISRMDINKHGVGNTEEGCICTEASLEFQVTDGNTEEEVVGCNVFMCGYNLVYASDETTSIISKRVEKPKILFSGVGVERRLKKLETALYSTPGKTRIIGVVGEPGIGKTTLATSLFKKRGCRFPSNVFLKMSKKLRLEWMRKTFLEKLLKNVNQTVSEETTHEYVKDGLLQAKSFIVLDDVSDKKQLEFLLGNLHWIKKGSKIIITTRDKSLVEGFAHETYMVPKLNQKEAMQLFNSHAFDDYICSPTKTFLNLSIIFVHNAKGNPSAIEFLGRELHDKDEGYWEHKMKTMRASSNTKIKDDGGRSFIDQPNKKNKFLSIDKLENIGKEETISIFIDMSEVTKRTVLERITFKNMCNLRDIHIYDSFCPRQCKADCKLYFPDGLRFPLKKVRNLYWEKFPLGELPSDFRPENLVTLRLPYSKIERVWEGLKDIPRLKFIDLRHSSKLLNISALSMAENLLKLNLEGCTILEELPLEIENMKSLVFLNLRGCIRLWSLPEMNLISLKTLILTDCLRLKEFQVISESLEYLHLDGTSIKRLPPIIKNLRRLVFLNLRNCKLLEQLPNSLSELKYLEELILSGCSSLKNLPDVKHCMKNLQILLFDGTGATEMPKVVCFTRFEGQPSADMLLQPPSLPLNVKRVSLLQRLCLSGNDFVSLQNDIGLLHHLKWLDVKQCKRLRSVPILPPRLQYFDAHGCDSLEIVANPLALPVVSEHIHATFNFTNCYKLNREAKNSIISYSRQKSQFVLDTLSRYSEDIVSETLIGACFPGWEIPVYFIHQGFGSMLQSKLPSHWFDNMFVGIALCAVIQFPSYNDQSNLSVKCNCVLKNEYGIHVSFSCTVGGWSESSNIPQRVESSHVFIGYVRRVDVNKQEEGCVFKEISLEVQVTNGKGEVVIGCEVMKCGFNLVYAPDEHML